MKRHLSINSNDKYMGILHALLIHEIHKEIVRAVEKCLDKWQILKLS